MENRVLTRMGDGERIWLSESDVRADIDQGTVDAAKRAAIPALTCASPSSLQNWFVCAAQTDVDTDYALDMADQAFRQTRQEPGD